MSNTGRRLRENNEEILKYINQLREQRNELGFLVEKQKSEKSNLEGEMARISYKLSLINKSLSQRMRALKLYDTTIMEIEAKYKGLADSTQGLLSHVKQESSTLENSIDKRIGTENECKDCPRCDGIPQVPQLDQSKSREGGLSEIPTKQPIEGERRTKVEYIGKHSEETARNLSDNPIYSRAMEYPMVLSPMINKEHMEQIKEKLTGNSTSQQGMRTLSNSENLKVPDRSSDSPNASKSDQPQSQNESERQLSGVTNTSGNFLDGDYSDQPSRDVSRNSLTYKGVRSKDTTPVDSTVPSSKDESQATTLTDTDEKEKLAIEDYDEVIEDVESGIPHNRNTAKKGKKLPSSVDVFREAYKTQHEFIERPQTLARYKKSIFNKRDQSLFTTEEE